MNTEGFKRKLTAVFSADVVGYSRLMGEDEAATVKTLQTYKVVMFILGGRGGGQVCYLLYLSFETSSLSDFVVQTSSLTGGFFLG